MSGPRRLSKHDRATLPAEEVERLTVERLAQLILLRSEVNDNGCLIWTGRVFDNGYGRVEQGKRRTHRVMWAFVNGPIPDGLVIDHECHNQDLSCPGGKKCWHRRCCNPSHLVPRTHAENIRAARRGPRPTAPRAKPTARRARRPRVITPTHCRNGHEYVPENVRMWKDGTRRCVTCSRARDRRARAGVSARAAA